MSRLLKDLTSIEKQTIHSNDGGFSLLEMIVAATIVGIATTAALPDFQRGIKGKLTVTPIILKQVFSILRPG